ncbi:Ankyrin repeat and KH domain-containing protein 1 [Symbiodinium microadriaticum]|uniref:Ankyrin repeat and KH domain-containing protein 1 n=1 Tax=Symbiodinium microadriaticum TaxID=2951 RepID=A0A1Q9EB70_SYMMI|nr:Ankyrin repeat and KH domain-containing protein 1 [Symbiodinium microadriaticum]
MAVLLRVLRISGEEVLALTADEIDELWNTFGTTVKALKQLMLQLPSMQGLSPHRLRLVRDGEVMSDHLDWGENLGLGPLKLDLVVLDFVELTDDQSLRFAEAVQEGRDDEVEELLHMPADPNIEGIWEMLPAATRESISVASRVRIAELLILLGADPRKAANSSGQSPLAVACERQQWDFVKFLLLPQLSLQEAVDVNEADTSGNTPLWFAAQNGGFSIANLLLFAGADRDRANFCGQTPLWIAAREGHLSVVQLLVLAGADRDREDQEVFASPAEVAEKEGHVDIAQLLRTSCLVMSAAVSPIPLRSVSAIWRLSVEAPVGATLVDVAKVSALHH